MVLANLLWKICIGKLLKHINLLNDGISVDVHVGRHLLVLDRNAKKINRELQKTCDLFTDIFFTVTIIFFYAALIYQHKNNGLFVFYVISMIMSFIGTYVFLSKAIYLRQYQNTNRVDKKS